MDLPRRLQRLEEIFNINFSLVERPEEPERQIQPATEVEEPVMSQPQQIAMTEGGRSARHPPTQPPAEEPDAPKNFLTHDPGPRACTEGAFDSSRFTIGESLDEDAEFCPWNVIRGYPYNFVGKTNRPHVTPFFDRIFAGRAWDFFYLNHPTKPKEKPYLLVPTAQFQEFLDFINEKIGIALAIPGGISSDRFFMTFGQGGTPRPRYLKRVQDKQEFEIDQWPDVDTIDAEAFQSAPRMRQDDWLEKLKLISVPPKKDKDQKKKERSAMKRADREHMLEESQILLGLKQGRAARGGKNGGDVVFICVDVEAIERPPNPVSEIGIAILEGKDIQSVPRGPCGRDWWPLIKAHHLRTMEYSGLVNYEFVAGCPDAFDFGTSTFPTRAELPDAVVSILSPYAEASREIVVVGHDTKQDIQYLASIGVDLMSMKSITRMLDSQVVHKAWKDIDNGRGLEGVLADLGIASQHLHNAGNDAVFTLRAIIGVSIEEMRQREAEAKGEEYEPELWNV